VDGIERIETDLSACSQAGWMLLYTWICNTMNLKTPSALQPV